MPMNTWIRPKNLPRLYVREWRNHAKMSQEQLGEIIGTNKAQVSNWERGARRPSSLNQAALADALGIEVIDLYRHPDQPSLDEMLRDAPREVHEQVREIVNVLLKKHEVIKKD